jgi:purine-cytosine permease-like protein
MAHYNKAIVAFLTALVSLIAIWWPPIAQYASTEIIVSVSGVIGAVLVYLVPNKPRE